MVLDNLTPSVILSGTIIKCYLPIGYIYAGCDNPTSGTLSRPVGYATRPW